MVVPGSIGICWRIGDVSDRGFESLQFSIWGMWRLMGPDASYCVRVQSIPLQRAWALTGKVPTAIQWHDETDDLEDTDGINGSFTPPRIWPDHYELSLDNQCIIWEMPEVMRRWLSGDEPDSCLVAEDMCAMLAHPLPLSGEESAHRPILGMPPGLDHAKAAEQVRRSGEPGGRAVQQAAASLNKGAMPIPLQDLTICSPFWPHIPNLGRCGGHFAGINTRRIAWDYLGQPAAFWIADHWRRHRRLLEEKVGLPGVCVGRWEAIAG